MSEVGEMERGQCKNVMSSGLLLSVNDCLVHRKVAQRSV